MKPLGAICVALSLGALSVPSMADVSTQSIRVSCENAPEEYCAALVAALSARSPKADVSMGESAADALNIELIVLDRSESHITGQLAWSTSDGQRSEGPDMTVTVMDAKLLARSPNDLAQGLLTVTKLPL